MRFIKIFFFNVYKCKGEVNKYPWVIIDNIDIRTAKKHDHEHIITSKEGKMQILVENFNSIHHYGKGI